MTVFHMGVGDLSSGVMLTKQALYPLSHIHRPIVEPLFHLPTFLFSLPLSLLQSSTFCQEMI